MHLKRIQFCVAILLSVSLFDSIPLKSMAEEWTQEQINTFCAETLPSSGYMLTAGDTVQWEAIQTEISLCTIYGTGESNVPVPLHIVSMDTSSIDVAITGTYSVVLTLALSEPYDTEYTLAPALTRYEIPVCISDPINFDLWQSDVSDDAYTFSFLQPCQPAQSQVYFYTSNVFQSFDVLDSVPWTPCDNTMTHISASSFTINRSALAPQAYTYFYIQTDVGNSGYAYVWEDGSALLPPEETGGDRDGGDADYPVGDDGFSQFAPFIPVAPEGTTKATTETSLQTTTTKATTNATTTSTVKNHTTQPTVTTAIQSTLQVVHAEAQYPAVAVPLAENAVGVFTIVPDFSSQSTEETVTMAKQSAETEATENTPAIESTSADQDVLSGYRYRLMQETGGGVAKFSKHGFTIAIPEDAYSIADNDVIAVTLTMTDSFTFSIDITINHTTLTPEAPIALWVPKTMFPDSDIIELQHNDVIQEMQLQTDSDLWSTELSTLGTYKILTDGATPTVAETDGTTANESNHWGWKIAFAGVVLTLIVISGVWYRRKKKC